MNKTTGTIVTIVAAIIVLVGGFYLWQGMNQAAAPSAPAPAPSAQVPAPAPSQPVAEPDGTTTGSEPKTVIVTFTDSGYAPASVTIKAGDTVTFRNESDSAMWTASGAHPSHALYSGTTLSEHCPDAAQTSFDACGSTQPGGSWSFTFQKTGTWKYHNHVGPSDFGTIVVE